MTNEKKQMFDRIAAKYDIANHLLSFGQDFSWRRTAAKLIRKEKDFKLIDLATGTGDVLTASLNENPQIQNAVGLDFSEKMLDICEKKLHNHNLKKKVSLIKADMTTIPFDENSFDVATTGFGIRNTNEPDKTLKEIYRILKPAGQVIILEFVKPDNRMLKGLYLLYLRYILPFLAMLISGEKTAYVYLNKTIESFYTGRQFRKMMENAGFVNINVTKLTLGITCVFQGFKKTK